MSERGERRRQNARIARAWPGFQAVPAQLEREAWRCLETGEVHGAQVHKPGRVWRLGDWALKRWPAPKSFARRLGRSRAQHCAELALRIGPALTPQPLLAVELRPFGLTGASALAVTFVEGRWLHRLQPDDAAARAAMPSFIANLHRRGVAHGDLNARNALWDGERWQLIDLDGARLVERVDSELVLEQWARLLGALRLQSGAREMFAAYARVASQPIDVGRDWPRVERRARSFMEQWDRRLAAGVRGEERPDDAPQD